MADLEIRLLRREDDRGAFACGEPALDRFFQHYAGQNQFKLHLAVTWVAVRDMDILGYATVAGGSLERRTVPDAKLRKRLPDYPLPALRLARLGVDRRAQGLGIGKALIRHVLRLALAQRDHVGCVGVVTDAKPDAVAFYDGLGFSRLEGVREGVLHGDPTPMFLDIAAISAAVDAAG
ncbi:MAG: GNAT family N-acetyltransferase [Alphaproteobacteria bacterium]|nr:GNAT family N-acetyltransferase [Alphaproteobacteria bacterium]